MLSDRKKIIYKLIVSVTSGALSWYLADYAVVIDTVYNIKINYGLLFPLIVSLSWGAAYGGLSVMSGLFFTPFLLMPSKGIGNILTACFYLTWVLLNGYFCREGKNKKEFNIWFLIVNITFCILYYVTAIRIEPVLLRFNFQLKKMGYDGLIEYISPMIMKIQIINFVTNIIMFVALAKNFLALPAVRKIFCLEPLPFSNKIVSVAETSAIIMILYILLDSVLDQYYVSTRGFRVSLFMRNTGGLTRLPMFLSTAALISYYAMGTAAEEEVIKAEYIKSEKNYKLIYRNIIDVYMELDKAGQILKCSPSCFNMFGYTKDYAEEENIKKFMASKSEVEKLLQRLFENERITNEEIKGRRSNGSQIHLLLEGKIIQNEDCREIAILMIRDISKQKKAEQEIRQLNQNLEHMVKVRTGELQQAYTDLESFSYTVSHEFKTPVRELEAYLSVLEEDNEAILSAQSKADINAAKKICSDTLDMVQKMMVYAKAGYSVMKLENIDMEHMVRECFEEVQKGYPDKDIVMQLYQLPQMQADRFLMKQAVFNILSNAVKFSSIRKTIRLTAGYMKDDKYLYYYFLDNGIGLESADVEKIFGLFDRMQNREQFEGSGVGLATVKRIVERHKGEVSVFGKEDKGCLVTFRFPVPVFRD